MNREEMVKFIVQAVFDIEDHKMDEEEIEKVRSLSDRKLLRDVAWFEYLYEK